MQVRVGAAPPPFLRLDHQTPADVLRYISSPFAPDKDATRPQAHAARLTWKNLACRDDDGFGNHIADALLLLAREDTDEANKAEEEIIDDA